MAFQDTTTLIFLETCLLVICEFAPFLSPFIARKAVHTASGLMMLHLDPKDPLARYFVYSVVFSSLLMVWELAPFKFRYSKSRDVGITVYLIIVGIFFYTQTPLHIITPVFFADPAGAVVGKWLTKNKIPNRRWTKVIPRRLWRPSWIGEKTLGGSAAVLIAGFLSLTFGNGIERAVIATLIAGVEALSKDYDNLLIAAVVLVAYQVVG